MIPSKFVGLLIGLFAVCYQTLGQQVDVDNLRFRAEKYFSIKNYEQAYKLFEELTKVVPEDHINHYKTGVCLFNFLDINEQVKSIPYFEFAKKNLEVIPKDVYFYLGQAYHKDMRIEEALESFNNYKRLTGSTENEDIEKKLEHSIQTCKNALVLLRQKKNIAITNLGPSINSANIEYNPVVAADQSRMAFTVLDQSSEPFKEEIRVTYNNGKGSWEKPETIDVGTENNVGTAGMSADGKEMMIFIGGVNQTGNLYSIQRKGKKWSTPNIYNKQINSGHLESTASTTPDGRTIYFASNRPGGYGGFDIYMSKKDKDGNWGKAINLGPIVNTSANEDAPFIHPDQRTLFFTSNGHNTIGGQDIFKTVKMGQKWSNPENMGFPINTAADDNYFTLTADGKKGFFSSDRKGGFGRQDIYWFDMPEEYANIPLTLVKGRILAGEGKNKKPVSCKINVVEKDTGKPLEYVYSPDIQTGNYLMIFPPNKSYNMIIKADGYLPHTISIEVPRQTYFYELYQQINLKSVKQFDKVVGQEVTVQNAFFDTKKEDVINTKKANESMLVRNDSVDVYELMDLIIASEDEIAFDYLSELYKINPLESVEFNASSKTESADAVYFYDENKKEDLELHIVGNDTIYTLPELNVKQASIAQKNKPINKITYDKKLLESIFMVYFSAGDSIVQEDYLKQMKEVVTILDKNKSLGIEISGFASPEGDQDKNKVLSNARANEVLNYFNTNGIPRRRIIAKGLGVTNDNTEKEKNRRVEIRIVDLDKI